MLASAIHPRTGSTTLRGILHHSARALKIGRNMRVTLKDAGEEVGNTKTGPLQEGELKLVNTNAEAPSS